MLRERAWAMFFAIPLSFLSSFKKDKHSNGELVCSDLGEWRNRSVSSLPKFPLVQAVPIPKKDLKVHDIGGSCGLKCPGCGYLGVMPRHCEMFKCPTCEKDMHLIGRTVHIWY